MPFNCPQKIIYTIILVLLFCTSFMYFGCQPQKARPVLTDELSIKPGSVRLEYIFNREVAEGEYWDYQPQEHSSVLPVASLKALFTGTSHGRIISMDWLTGDINWFYDVDGPVDAPPVYSDGILFVGGTNSQMYALDGLSGKLIWEFAADGPIAAAATVSDDWLFFLSSVETLYCLNKKTGGFVWKQSEIVTSGVTVKGQGTPLVVDDMVFVGFSSGELNAFQKENGTSIWSVNLGRGKKQFTDIDSAPVYVKSNDSIIASSYNGGLFALKRKDGGLLWHKDLRGVHTPVVNGDKVYITTSFKKVMSLDALTGDVHFTLSLEKYIPSKPELIGDFLVFTTSAGPFYIIDKASGYIHLKFEPGAGFYAPVSVFDKSVYLLSNGGYVYAMRVFH